MTKTTAATGSTARLALGALALVGVCLCVGVMGGAAFAYFANRDQAEPAVEYILDASPRMAQAGTGGQETRLSVARAVLAEIVRPADGAVSAGLRVFGNGAVPEACRDTALLVPLAPASQGRIATTLTAVEAGQAADAALAEAMLAAIRDLGNVGGPHTLVVVTGGQDACTPEAGQLIAQEAERAGIELETFVVGFQLAAGDADAIRGLMADVPGGTFLEAHDRAGLDLILKGIQARIDRPETTTVDTIIATAEALPTPGLNLGLDEAADIVEDAVVSPPTLDHPILVFPWPEPIDPDDLLLPWAAPDLGLPPDPIPVPGPSWFFWIDDFPAGKFAHPSRFALVEIATGAVTVSEQQWWPLLNGVGLWVDPAEYWNPERWSFSNFEGEPVGFPALRAPAHPPLARPPLLPPRQGTGQGVALVVNAWQSTEAGSTALVQDAVSMRAALTQAGLSTTYLGITADGSSDDLYSPEGFNNWMAGQAGRLAAGDTLVVYLTGHGDGTALAGLSPAALQAALRGFNAGVHIIVILDSSYSGAFIPPLTTSADRILTASSADLPALFDIDPVGDPNAATDTGSEFTSGFVDSWLGLLNDPAELAAVQQRALDEGRPVWDVLAELAFHGAVALDAGALTGQTAPQMVPAVQPTPTPSPTPTVTPTPTATLVPPTFTFTPRPPTAPPTPTLPPRPFVNFTADETTLTAGRCTTLRWDSGNIQTLFLNQEGVVGTSTREVCPRTTTTYTLVANTAEGQLTRQVTITVIVSAPPSFGNFDSTGSVWYNGTGCGPTAWTVFVTIQNADSAVLFYRILTSAAPSPWSSRPAAVASGSTWSRTLLPADMAGYGTVEYYFTATNAAGTSQSPVRSDAQYFPCIT